MTGLGLLVQNYRAFLFAPATMITLFSGLLLVFAIICQPSGIFGDPDLSGPSGWLYLASALAGSSLIWYNAIQGIREHDFTADIPVSLATLAAIAIGQYPAAAIVAVLLLIGGMLEELVAARADRALDALAQLLPDKVTVRREERDREISVDEIITGDIILVRSGERIAVDGEIVQGNASVNQSAITGESVPVEKRAGDTVFAGTLAVVGVLEVRTTRVGTETMLGQVRRLVIEAQEQKAPIERVLDRYAKLYTPIAVILGLFLWWWSGDAMRAITMLIVFCPCVMVLATPTALVASIGNAALSGSLVKKGATIEAMAEIDTVIFDKTGTLTLGEMRLVQAIPYGDISENDLMACAASAEKFSEHPVGKAVVRAAQIRGLPVPDPESWEVIPGLGVRAQAGGREVLAGRKELFEKYGCPLSDSEWKRIADNSREGSSAIPVVINKNIIGVLVFEDTIRENAEETVQELQRSGIRTVIISGDNRSVTERIAREVGITDIYAEILPDEKVSIVKSFQDFGHHVLFVGDGVNDGPALATADVGVAMGISGTDVAIETAGVALLSDDLSRLPPLIWVSQKALRTIRQNLVFAVGVLLIAVCLTVLGILTPVTGALLHELSSIPVIANSARLIGAK